jgi:NADPH:quinone reductase-like Zn-dependent oxidoreductase
MVGAEVFATVGSEEKRALLVERYGVPEERIFSSRDASFGPAIREATGGVGVDVVLNSLAGDLLRETWDCLAPFGRFVEIGKRDITSNTRLEMAKFDSNVTFSSVDLSLVAAERPGVMARTLNAVMALVTARVLRPVGPVTVFGLGEVEKAFRLLQSGKTTGKLVVVPKAGEQIRATRPTQEAALFREDSTYIIIGGTGGLGRSISQWMLAHGARNLVLASRSGRVDGAVADLINELQKANGKATITVEACDVANPRSVEALLIQCSQKLPPIRGCIHAAMVLRDVPFENMTHADYAEVIRCKVTGAWNLHTALTSASAALDFFILLSSAAGIVGSRGQAAYAAANTVLDALARHRRRLGLPGTSLALTAVQDVGYLAEAGAGRQAAVAQNLGGSDSSLREAEVLALVKAAVQGRMDSGGGHCLTGVGLAGIGNKELPYFAADAKFRRLRDGVAAASADDASASGCGLTPSTALMESALARATSDREAVQIVVAGLAAKLATILMIPPESLDPSRPVTAYGLDSLNAIEWKKWITRTFKENFQVLELLTAGSLVSLAASIWKRRKLAMNPAVNAVVKAAA